MSDYIIVNELYLPETVSRYRLIVDQYISILFKKVAIYKYFIIFIKYLYENNVICDSYYTQYLTAWRHVGGKAASKATLCGKTSSL